jgi:hypothetical protein
MPSQSEILAKTTNLLKQVPYRTTFERDNFLLGTLSGPRLLVELCHEIEKLTVEYNSNTQDWKKEIVLEEMNIINAKIDDILTEIGTTDIRKALEDAEPDHWVELLARRASIEALCQEVTPQNMSDMLKLPAELYESSITKTQQFLNIINKTTRIAERKANISNIQDDE